MSDRPLGGKVQLDTTEFKNGIAQINREMRLVESEFRAGAAALGDWGKSASGLEQRISALNSKMALQKEKIEAVRLQYEKQTQATGANSKESQELQIRLNKETETLGRMQAELNQSKTALDEMGRESGEAAGQVTKLEKSEEKATEKGKLFGGVVVDLVGGLRLIGDVAKAAVNGLVNIAKGLVGVVTEATDTAGALVDLSEKTGISVTRLQELQYAGDQLGVSTETITGAMAKLVRKMGEVGKSKEADEAFNRLGVAVRDADGQLRDNEAVFADALAALGKMENETERDALAMELFGKSAQELNPLIKAGADGLGELSQQAHEVGAVIGEDTVYGLEAFGDQLASMKASFGGIKAQLAGALLPVLGQFTSWLQSGPVKQGIADLVAWLGTNLPIAIQSVSAWVTGTLWPAMLQVWGWVQTTAIPIMQQLFDWLSVNLPPAIDALSKFWSETLWPALQDVWGWVQTTAMPIIKDLFDWLSVNLPPAITALGNFWTNTLQPALAQVWSFIEKDVIPILQKVWDWLATNLPPALQALSDLWNNTLLPAIKVVWDFLDKYVIPLLRTMQEVRIAGLKLALEALALVWRTVLKPALEAIWAFIDKYINPTLEKFLGWLELVASRGFEGIKKGIEIVNALLQKLKEALEKIKLPKAFDPGSPTPFEEGIWGIVEAMRALSREALPELGGKLPELGYAGAGGSRALTPGPSPVGRGGIWVPVTINAVIRNDMDLYRLAEVVANEIQRRAK